ncbi:hypothetical protein HZQ94_08960 [Elizabethkingia anophelis]|uniref:hypothetical protein n=1 Tax=Elizabethkingia anophelis TaxID=1117645 RepID=UPI0021A6E00C|nr:hypothetical protein [Elizabethkingia anophelis]MCT3680154.1 hypothetical protein [Elizabethkingia anophelis]
MNTTYFKTIVQKTTDTHSILVAVIPNDMLGDDLPTIAEFQAFKMPSTIYTGTYPTIKINSDTMKDRSDLIGMGIEGIIRGYNEWYTKTETDKDLLGISLTPNK